MKKLIKPIFLLAITLCILQAGASAQERLIYFRTNISTDTNGVINVTEHIKIFAELNIFKRGIFRTIPTTRKEKDGNTKNVELKDITVLQDGEPATFKTSSKSSELEIRVGQAEVFLDYGEHEYVISYNVAGQIGFFTDYDELYWNVTGNGWDLAIDTATCTFFAPGNANILQSSCYTGYTGSTWQNCKSSETGKNEISFSAYGLEANQGLTIAAAFPKGIIAPPPPPSFYEKNYSLILFSIFLGLVVLYMIVSWFKYGRDPEKPVVIPQFSPPQNLSPARIAMLYKGGYSKSIFALSIINLAVKGRLQIEDKTKKYLNLFTSASYTLTKKSTPANAVLAVEEESIMKDLFDKNSNVINANGVYNSKFANAFIHYEQHFRDDKIIVTGEKNRKFLWIPFLLLIGFWVSVSFYDSSQTFFSIFFTGALIVIPFLMGIPIFIFSSFFSKNPNFGLIYKGGLFMVCSIIISNMFLDKTTFSFNTKIIALFSIILIILFIAYRYLIQRPTQQKINLLSEVEGFKMYLGTTEENQMQFFNSPKMTPEHFEKMLPYALALGVEKIWGEKFQKVLELSGIDTAYKSNWYTGANRFSMSSLNHLNTGMGTVMQTASVMPSTSSSSSSGGSWSSGSSGGGSSGGGGGGGGGGGW